MIVSVAFLAIAPAVAVIVAVWDFETRLVVTVNPAEVAPVATVTLPGTPAAALLLLRLTFTLPVGAAPLRVTVPVTLPLPRTEAGESDRLVSTAGFTVIVTLRVTPLKEAAMVTFCDVETPLVPMVKVALAAPAGTITLVGTPTTPGLLLLRAIVAPPDGAFALRATVPTAEAPPVTV